MNDQAKVGRRVCMIVLLGCVALVLIGASSRVSWTRPIDAWLSTLPAEGRPVPWAELPSLYPDVPENENAALVYIRADVSVDTGPFHPYHQWTQPEKGDPPEAWEPIPTAVRDALANGVNEHAKTFDVLHEAAAMPRSRYPGVDLTDIYSCRLTHLEHLRSLARLEAWRIALCAERDDAGGAVDAVKEGLAIGRSLAGEPMISSQMDRWGCDRDILLALPRLVSRAHLTDGQLCTLGECIAALEYSEGMRKTILDELSFRIGNRVWYSGLTEWALPSNVFEVVGRAAMMMGFSWSNSFGLSDVEAAECIDFADRIIRMSRMSVLECFDPKWRLNKKHREHAITGTSFGVQFIDESLASYLRAELTPLAVQYVALTAIAIERYRLANHALPERLEDLVPVYLPRLLPDPSGGKPLPYKIDGAGYQVYSVGNNGRDDGGRGYADGTGADDIAVWCARPNAVLAVAHLFWSRIASIGRDSR